MDKIRAEFEDWVKSQFTAGIIGLGKKENGEYMDLYAKLMFEAFQAAKASQWISADVKNCILDARSVAMKNVLAARIPECGDFGAIAQDLDFVCNQLGLNALG